MVAINLLRVVARKVEKWIFEQRMESSRLTSQRGMLINSYNTY